MASWTTTAASWAAAAAHPVRRHRPAHLRHPGRWPPRILFDGIGLHIFLKMMLRVPPSPAAAATAVNHVTGATSAATASVRVAALRGASPSAGMACRAMVKGKEVLSGVVFQPFEELKGELSLVPQKPDQWLARHKFIDDCEATINEQINYGTDSGILGERLRHWLFH